jgi:putative ABC transport system permease protein
VSSARVGVLSSGTITAGRTFTPADANSDVAVVDSDYAKQNSLKAGSTVSVDSTNFTVIGIVFLPQGSATTGVFIPLAPAQKLSGMTSKVNTIYVSAASATEISTVAREISAVFPRATVTTSSDLASQITGSLSSAASLAGNLGTWLAVVALVAAFLLAALLMMSAVTRRVREFGTLKALGWRSRRVVEQVMGE